MFLRFAACGAACGSTAHAFLIPIDVVKTRMQSEPKKYPDMVSTFGTLVKEEVRRCCCRGGGEIEREREKEREGCREGKCKIR